jgi:hypothetical protein
MSRLRTPGDQIMMRTAPLILAVFATSAAAQAIADFEPWVQLHLSWTEVDAITGEPVARPNGVLNPGESARIALSASYIPIGTPVPQPPAPGPGWEIYGLWQVVLDISSPGGNWKQIGWAPGWTNVGWPTPSAVVVMLLQNPIVDFRNPIPELWHGIWTPAQYTNGVTGFSTQTFGSIDNRFIAHDGISIMLVDGVYYHTQMSIPISSSPAPCYANCDGSTAEPILTVDDFICFVNEFALAHTLPPAQQVTHYANCDGSTTQPVLTVGDFICFINEFAAGCP